jgi:hypothetical protein
MTVTDKTRRGLFSWLFSRRDEPTKTVPRRPARRDLTGGMVANEDMLRGLYHGTWQGLQFASPLAYTPISVPVNMMGLPCPHSDDQATQAALDEIVALMAERIPKLHRSALLVGTAWRWPRFDAKAQALTWEEIPDQAISDILLDITTGTPAAILTDEELELSVAENSRLFVRRKRRFDVRQVAVTWLSALPAGVADVTSRNVSGTLPIAFTHDSDEGELRGHSVLSRVIRDLKDYHDIDYMRSEVLTKFRPKQIQSVNDFDLWLRNNGLTQEGLDDFDIADTDLVFNVNGISTSEETDYKFMPSDATAPYDSALQNKFWKIYEGTGIPEMFWGGLANGNYATADNQMQQAVTYVDQLRQQFNKPYYDLFSASLRLLSIVRMESYADFEMDWNRLESVSADVKSQIFQRFGQAIAQLAGSATLTKKQLYTLWTLNYPESDPGTFAEFEKGIGDMAQFKQFLGLDYFSGLADANGETGDLTGTTDAAKSVIDGKDENPLDDEEGKTK